MAYLGVIGQEHDENWDEYLQTDNPLPDVLNSLTAYPYDADETASSSKTTGIPING